MEFYVNHPVLFLLSGILIATVLVQSVWFLVKALRRAKALGMDTAKIKKRSSRPRPLRWHLPLPSSLVL